MKIEVSDELISEAYDKMLLDKNHLWTKHTDHEVDCISEWCKLEPKKSLLDIGCGNGRHLLKLREKNIDIYAIDLNDKIYDKETIKFFPMNACSFNLNKIFDTIICLYDVIGSYANNEKNQNILLNISNHLNINGHALISVMSAAYTLENAKYKGTSSEIPELVKNLKSNSIMEKTGNVFDPEYYVVNTDNLVVYRKEIFENKSILLTDKRFFINEFINMCNIAGLKVIWSRAVKAGNWKTNNAEGSSKELLFLCTKSE